MLQEEADDARERSANLDMLNSGTADLFNKVSDMEKVTKATSDQLLMDLYLDNILPGMGVVGGVGGGGMAVGWFGAEWYREGHRGNLKLAAHGPVPGHHPARYA